MLHLVLTNQLAATHFAPTIGCLLGKANGLGDLLCDECRWIQQTREGVAIHIGNIYDRRGEGCQKGAR